MASAQYEIPSDAGLNRYWTSWYSFFEEYPDTPFSIFVTGQTMDWQLKQSTIDDSRIEQYTLPKSFNGFDIPGIEDEDLANQICDDLYISKATVCALIDGKDEAGVWQQVATFFPDYEQRFIEPRGRDFVLDSLSDRFVRRAEPKGADT